MTHLSDYIHDCIVSHEGFEEFTPKEITEALVYSLAWAIAAFREDAPIVLDSVMVNLPRQVAAMTSLINERMN